MEARRGFKRLLHRFLCSTLEIRMHYYHLYPSARADQSEKLGVYASYSPDNN